MEEEVRGWIAAVRPARAEECAGGLGDVLKSGVVLCELANALKAGSVGRISQSKMPFPQRENVLSFINAARELGVPDRDNFDTSDLFEQSNMRQVMICVASLGRAAHHIEGFGGPCLGKASDSRAKAAPKHKAVHTGTGLWGKSGGTHDAGGASGELVYDEAPVAQSAEPASGFESDSSDGCE